MNGDKVRYSSYNARNELDVSDLKERGEKLKQAIFDAVKDTQGIIMSPLPNVLIMSAAQYMDQEPNPEIMPAYKSKDRLYQTPLNIMDIVVKDPENFPPDDDDGILEGPSADPDYDEVAELLRKEGTLGK